MVASTCKQAHTNTYMHIYIICIYLCVYSYSHMLFDLPIYLHMLSLYSYEVVDELAFYHLQIQDRVLARMA